MDKANKLPPKVIELSKHPKVENVNNMIDEGFSMRKIQSYLKKEGFSISIGYLGIYKKHRTKLSVEEAHLDKFLHEGSVAKVAIESSPKTPLTNTEKLKKDMDFLEMVIQTGADHFRKRLEEGEEQIPIQTVFEAIKLRDKLTEGSLDGLTEYGIQYLQQITEDKYTKLINYLYRQLPKDVQGKALKEMEIIEHDFYKTTDYYEDYLRVQGKTEKEISDKLHEK